MTTGEGRGDVFDVALVSRTGTYLYDATTDRATWSDGMNAIYGRAPGTPAPTWDELDEVIPGGSRVFRERLEAIGRGETPGGFEHQVIRPDGTTRWVLSRATFELAPDGRPLRVFGTETDVTNLHAAFEAARAGDQLAMSVIQGTEDVVYVKDLAGKMLLVNDVTARLLGRSPASMVGLDEHSWFPPEQAEAILASERRVVQTGERLSIEERIPLPDGTELTYLTTKSALRAPDGTIIGVLAVARDITDRQRAEAALRASEQRYADLVASVPVGIFSARTTPDRQLRLDYVSPRAAQILGMGAPALDHSPIDQVHADDLAEALAVLGSQFDDPRPITWEGRIHRGPELRHVRIQASVAGFDGEDLLTHGYVLDTTEEREAAAALEASRALRESVFESLDDALLVFDLQGRIIAANQAASTAFAGPGAKVEGHTHDQIGWSVFDEDGDPLPHDEHPVAATLRSGLPVHDAVLELAHPTGARTWHRVNTAPLRDGDGRLTGAVAAVRDITAERELERKLHRAQRLEAVGQLAGGVAHDFNNLLAAIRGYTELVREDLPAGSRARADLDEALRAADRASSLTRQLLAFARRASIKPEVLDPAEVVEQLVPMLRRLVGETIEIETSIAPDLGRIRADVGQLEQVVVNLAVNARDAMPEGGRLSIWLHNEDCVLEASEVVPVGPVSDPGAVPVGEDGGPSVAVPCIRIRVCDTGTGMDAGTQARIFEPFFTTKEIGKGSGMGLATVYGIVGAAGGRIGVHSVPGEGTTFTIDLPRVDAAPAAALRGVEPAAEASRGTGTVLLVEDELQVRLVTARMLRSLGYTVVEASGPTEALAWPEDIVWAADVLVTDVVMPRMSGPRLADLLDERRGRLLPTVLISGYAPEPALADRLEQPGTVFLGKPFSRDALAASLRTAIEESTADG